MSAGPLQGTSLAERLGDAKVRLTVCSQVCPLPLLFGLRASVALGTLCLVCFRDVYRLQPCWVPCVLVAIEDSIPWFQMGAHNGVDPPAPYLLVCSRRAGLKRRHFMGQVTSMNLGSPSATSWVAALLCRLACLRVRPFRQSRRTRVSSPINTARVSLFAILECTTNRYIHHALRLIIDWVGPAALG